MSKLFMIQKKVIPCKRFGWSGLEFDFRGEYIKWHVVHTMGTRLNLIQAVLLYCMIKLSFAHKDKFLKNGSKGKFKIVKVPLKWWEKNGK